MVVEGTVLPGVGCGLMATSQVSSMRVEIHFFFKLVEQKSSFAYSTHSPAL